MLPAFKLCVGGVLGSGKQFMSWVALEDLVSIISFCIQAPSIAGPINACSPNPVTNREFTNTLASMLGRPAVLPVPAFALRLLFGQMADETLLAGQRVVPKKLVDAGFQFKFSSLGSALGAALGI